MNPNIRLAWINLPMTNTPAYFTHFVDDKENQFSFNLNWTSVFGPDRPFQ